jgi:single-strand DNA-binding protein
VNLNKCFIGGNLARDPELKSLQSGQSVCNFSIASNRKWVDKDGEKHEDATFFDCVAWQKTGENIAKFFSKGKPIFVIARATNESWGDKDTGKKMSKMKFVVEEFSFVGNKGGDEAAKPAKAGGFKQPGTEKTRASNDDSPSMSPDDIPF